MEGELDENTHEYQEDSTSTPENVADTSSLSGDEAADQYVLPSPRKRKSAKKKVISVPIDGVDGSSRSKGEVYPPPDSWSWRKYGQKPIKGSPYPRGYYRCSSSKGCPAKKQVERNRLDPTSLVITYAHDHNHAIPTTTNKHHHHHHHRRPSAEATATGTATTDVIPAKLPPEELTVFTNRPDLEPDNSGFSDLTAELGWFFDVGSTAMIECPTLVGPKWADTDITVTLPIGEEDQSLFGDLDELTEYSVVFRRRSSTETPCYGGTG